MVTRIKLFVIVVFPVLFSFSCEMFTGEDGIDGDAFIAYSWAVGPILFYTEDPAFTDQSYIYNGRYEDAAPGTYYFEYISWDDSFWFGEYTIYINEGTEGGFLTDGINGEDIYFELACYSFGPSFYEWSEEFAFRAMEARAPASSRYKNRLLEELDRAGREQAAAGALGLVLSDGRDFQGDYTHSQTIQAGKYTVELRYGKK